MTAAPAPIWCTYDGESFIPKVPSVADRYYVVGETYKMAPHEDRSSSSHNHYFASVTEAWRNLPEAVAEHFPTAEHLRKYALIKAGYADHRSIALNSKAEAQRVASFVKPVDEFSIVTVHEATVTIYTAQSQSRRAMGNKTFQDSKRKVLDIVSAMIAVPAQTLVENAGKAA